MRYPMISKKELDALRKYIEANLEVEDDGIDICSVSACSIQDLIIKYCLKEKIYDLIDINEYLYNNNCPKVGQ